jgi:acyl-CoA reductase-like NAD-dependent aldehyde dehydrogenase
MEYPYYCAGEWMKDGTALDVTSPATGEVVGTTFRPSASAVERAVAAARGVFPEARRIPAHRRAALLRGIAAGIEKRVDSLAGMIASEAGKPIRTARGEVSRAVLTFTEGAEESTRLYGEVLPLDVSHASEGRLGIVRYFPVGPVLAITPFNFPLNLVAHKIAPALGVGCPLILKPSSETPLTALMLAGIIEEAGATRGMISVLPVSGGEAGALARRPEVRKVTFTGSAEVGWGLKAAAFDKKVTLELGGNAAVIVHDDWDDLDGAVSRIVVGGYAYAGQVCISIQRIYVHRSIYELFTDIFLGAVGSLTVGDPLSEETDVGPMITEKEARRVEVWVKEAADGGARILTGGRRNGMFYDPTIITGARSGMKVVDEEVFGPVTALFPYNDFEEALAAVNDSRFGLQAGVYTRDVRNVMRAFEELEVGGIVIGDIPTFRVDRMPYGGVKASGYGREGLRYAIREMCERRLLVYTP